MFIARTFPCPVAKCKTCDFIDSATTISGPKFQYHAKHHFTCTSYLIYCISYSRCHWKKIENPQKVIEWKLYGPLLEIELILIIHNNCIFPYYGYSIEIVWIYYGFSSVITNLMVQTSHFFQCVACFILEKLEDR